MRVREIVKCKHENKEFISEAQSSRVIGIAPDKRYRCLDCGTTLIEWEGDGDSERVREVGKDHLKGTNETH